MIPTPPAELWVQYSLIGILFLCIGIMAGGLFIVWRLMLRWQAEQDAKREAEREKQRKWETRERRQQDQRWQAFLRDMQKRWEQTDKEQVEVLERLTTKIDNLTLAFFAHDTYVRARRAVGDDPEPGTILDQPR